MKRVGIKTINPAIFVKDQMEYRRRFNIVAKLFRYESALMIKNMRRAKIVTLIAFILSCFVMLLTQAA